VRNLSFFCVLRASKTYGPEHVTRLRAAVARNCTLPHRFVVLSDVEVGCERIPLREPWPRWWSKIELFRPGVADPDGTNVYLDLDLLITGNIDRLVSHPHRFSMARDDKFAKRANSSVMAWTGDRSNIYAAMKANARWNRFRFNEYFGMATGWVGDQGLTEWTLLAAGTPADRLDVPFPGYMKVFRQLLEAERTAIDVDGMRNVLFVSFQGASKPGSAELRDNAYIRRYW
jgi:hypothetical protein